MHIMEPSLILTELEIWHWAQKSVLISPPGGSMQAKLESHLPQPIQQNGVSLSLCLALTCCRLFQSTANQGSLHCTFSMMACIQNKHTKFV